MSNQYTKPPIVEALCAFQFIPSEPWDMTIAGLLYERIQLDFPIREQRAGLRVGVHTEEDVIEQRIDVPVRMRFLRSDKSALVQVAPDRLIINHLKPYPAWKPFKSLVIANLQEYQEVAKPKALQTIGLRYINEIQFDASRIELPDYFSYYPYIPPDLPQDHGPFNICVHFPSKDVPEQLTLILRNMPPEEAGVLSIVLDINYAASGAEAISLGTASEWIEVAHTKVEDAFEGCIPDACRSLFEEEQ